MSHELSATAVVLRRRDGGESDRRLVLYSREFGRLEAVAKGARKGGSRLAGCSEPLMLARFQLNVGRAQRFVSQAQPVQAFAGLRSDYDRLSLALALAEVVEATSQPENPEPEVFDLLVYALRALELGSEPGPVFVWSALRLMELEGVAPSFVVCAATGEALVENPAWVSPTAGGYVRPEVSEALVDRFLAPAEALIGLAKTAELDEPPAHLRKIDAAVFVLHRLWEHNAHRKLPAFAAALGAMQLGQNGYH